MRVGGDPVKAPPASFDSSEPERRPRSRRTFVSLLILSAAITAGLLWLGNWQLHRRVWKLALIERVDSRIHAEAMPAPEPARWPNITRLDAYRHLRVTGHYENDRETLVQASTDLGTGYWVVTPFETQRGFTVLVNRGFVPDARKAVATRQAGQIQGPTSVTGLLRVTEPKGRILRHNEPQANRWFSRDVQAIAKARGLGRVAPYFIDADAGANPKGGPVGGLTVTTFPNNHLVYAITWFGLALMVVGGTFLLVRDERRLRGGRPSA